MVLVILFLFLFIYLFIIYLFNCFLIVYFSLNNLYSFLYFEWIIFFLFQLFK